MNPTNYIKNSIQEMKKVTWPTKKEATQYTLLVVGISVGISLFLGGLDFIFNWALGLIIK